MTKSKKTLRTWYMKFGLRIDFIHLPKQRWQPPAEVNTLRGPDMNCCRVTLLIHRFPWGLQVRLGGPLHSPAYETALSAHGGQGSRGGSHSLLLSVTISSIQEVAVGNARKYVDSLNAESMSVVVNTILAGYEASSSFSRAERCR